MRIIRAVRKPVVFLALILGIILAAVGCGQKIEKEAGSAPLKLTLALQPAPYSGLIAVAEEKGFFRQEGVEVKINFYSSGLEALEAMQKGEAHLATVADIAFAGMMNEDPSLRVIASIGLSKGSQIVARKDRNIHKVSDLKGKRIGYSPGTISDYFLYTFLMINHLSPKEVTAVAIPPARQAEAIITGEIDALSAFEIYAFVAKERLGANALSWDSQNNLSYQWFLTAREIATRSPEALKRLLKALIKAEAFILTHEDEAKNIIVRKWNFSPEYIRQSWDRIRMNVSFNQSVVTSLQSYAKWKMDKEGNPGDPPDVLNYLYTAALDEIDHRLVTIFR